MDSNFSEKNVVTIELSHIGQLTNTLDIHNVNFVRDIEEQVRTEESSLNYPSPGLGIKSATEDFQRQIITSALNRHDNNWSAAARELKTDRANLNRMAKRLGISIIKTIQN